MLKSELSDNFSNKQQRTDYNEKLTIILMLTALLYACSVAQEFSQPEAAAHKPDIAADTYHRYDNVGHPTFMSPQASPIVVSNGYVFVVNTPADTVDIIDTNTHAVIKRINVGIDPVSVTVRPDGKEVWVANHISDSVSVIDTNPTSPTWFQIIDTLQDFDPETRATRFDAPVGIAFASNEKAHVALSSENQVAVINVNTRHVEKKLDITAQDPRAITVRGDRLYVIPFESNNKTQLSGAPGPTDNKLITFDAQNM